MPGDRRLIPAHAGKTLGLISTDGITKAHPRSRGENIARDIEAWGDYGSSPLTRGKLRAHERREMERMAHPRSRGENQRSSDRDRAEGGSSPLTRGKLRAIAVVDLSDRLIPAHAGKTLIP